LEGLADVEWAARKASDEGLIPPDYYRDIGNAINGLADIADPPEHFLGKVFRDADEVEAVRAVFAAWELVKKQVGFRDPKPSDSRYYATPAWRTLAEAAATALQCMEALDA